MQADELPEKARTPAPEEHREPPVKKNKLNDLNDWYERHFHACAIAGRTPISSGEWDALRALFG